MEDVIKNSCLRGQLRILEIRLGIAVDVYQKGNQPAEIQTHAQTLLTKTTELLPERPMCAKEACACHWTSGSAIVQEFIAYSKSLALTAAQLAPAPAMSFEPTALFDIGDPNSWGYQRSVRSPQLIPRWQPLPGEE